ncbi:Uncharacterised protein [Mycobacteroides abscessus subsp. abscessus]|uniref:hypothetical protein n=1 Tax=Mycobacteroides abscessus TaxID=36809 RepID=UPI0009276996|nr:hypothetical protein [Mycobacteroides abscessus]PVB44307.1 hypothetical protein DDJ39_15245 [Mycobacteroides abscessus]QSN53755.1 hypothetical protein I3U39_08790 [Mycobacteroides abscessus subsp. abscessus]SIH19429.1 Uncharacterised protein [Mycobacteroides abscessus subsp. abscessus]SIH27626.1 Uncharacterised protein [Mycobacteroides abscessus subsp. abscessus]SII59249.1 Uncharacterised protein [Mycobacteroides abscessus subsp. abscessus]
MSNNRSDDNIINFPAAEDNSEKLLQGHVEPAFQVLDHPRTYANVEYNRVVMDFFGYLEPYEDETDGWRSMPLRLAHNTATGWCIECGPYTFDAADIKRLREAIAAYEGAVGA